MFESLLDELESILPKNIISTLTYKEVHKFAKLRMELTKEAKELQKMNLKINTNEKEVKILPNKLIEDKNKLSLYIFGKNRNYMIKKEDFVNNINFPFLEILFESQS